MDLRDRTKRGVFAPGAIRSAAFTPSGEPIVAVPNALAVVQPGAEEAATRVSFPETTASAALSPDGAMAVALTNGAVIAYDTHAGGTRWRVPLSGTEWQQVGFTGSGYYAMVAGADGLLVLEAGAARERHAVQFDAAEAKCNATTPERGLLRERQRRVHHFRW